MLVVVDSGGGNLRSVEKSLAAAGAAPVVTADPEIVRRADQVVAPGQGAFADCMAGLRGGLDEALVSHIKAGKPYLGICLGLQILFEESEERGPHAGLGIFAGNVARFRDLPGRKIPHMGWNQVAPGPAGLDDAPVELGQSHYYFVHSYYVRPEDASLVALTATYGEDTFCAAIRRDNVVATQFHPEKSQQAGLALLRWFLCL